MFEDTLVNEVKRIMENDPDSCPDVFCMRDYGFRIGRDRISLHAYPEPHGGHSFIVAVDYDFDDPSFTETKHSRSLDSLEEAEACLRSLGDNKWEWKNSAGTQW